MQEFYRAASRQEIEARIIGMIARISVPQREAFEVSPSASLDQDLNVDSLSFIELLIELENTFGFTFDEDFLLMGAYPDVGAVVSYVAEAVSSSQSPTSLAGPLAQQRGSL